MFDFTYWKSPEDYETKVNESDALSSVEDAFQQTFTQTLDRFYTLFSSIVKYHEDLTKFLQDLDEGYFIQYTLDNLLQDTTGKQLLCESLYLYGSMLLLMERHLHGRVREKIIVAHYRYTPSASGALDDIDKVCKVRSLTPSSELRTPMFPNLCPISPPPEPPFASALPLHQLHPRPGGEAQEVRGEGKKLLVHSFQVAPILFVMRR